MKAGLRPRDSGALRKRMLEADGSIPAFGVRAGTSGQNIEATLADGRKRFLPGTARKIAAALGVGIADIFEWR